MTQESKKKILFYPLNSPGHINSLLGLADRIKTNYDFKTIFVVVGQMMASTIQDHGHEVIEIQETNPHEDYEILDGEDVSKPVDEEEKKKLGLEKKKFPGVLKWPQILSRYGWIFSMDASESIKEAITITDKYMVGELLEYHDTIEQIIEDTCPDLIIVDNYYIPPCIVNNKRKIPWVKIHSANPLLIVDTPLDPIMKPRCNIGTKLLTKAKRQRLQKEEPETWLAMTEEWRRVNTLFIEALQSLGGRLHQFLSDKGCPPLKPGQQSHESPILNIYLYPKELDYDQDDDLFRYSERWFRCDSLVRKPDNKLKEKVLHEWESKLAEAMVNKKEMVYFSLGSLASGNTRLIKPVVDILAKDQQRLYVVSKGVNGDKFELNPSNMIGANFLPQTFFLERAKFAIIHGGNNSISECINYGVPMIVMPAFADQFDNAQRVEDLELGRRVDLYKVDESLLDVIEEVSADKDLALKLKEIASNVIERDDSNKAAFMLKKLVDEGTLDLEFINKLMSSTRCPKLKIHAGIKLRGITTNSSIHKPGNPVIFICESNDTKQTIKCLEDGRWNEQPHCPDPTNFTCPDPNPILHGTFNGTGPFKVGSVITFECDYNVTNPSDLYNLTGSSRHLKCLPSPKWNHPQPTCEPYVPEPSSQVQTF